MLFSFAGFPLTLTVRGIDTVAGHAVVGKRQTDSQPGGRIDK